jgi:zinc D-Ala-D-Ala carboxypeptidase
MQLSEHLTLAEVTKSQTATRLGIDNDPDAHQLAALKAVAENIFEPLRNHFGVPIGISSGLRSKALNKAIGGSTRSQHCHGQALDIDADIYGGVNNRNVFRYIQNNLDFDQLIWEFGSDDNPAWVHVSFVDDGTNRGQTLRAIKENGKTKYIRWKQLL